MWNTNGRKRKYPYGVGMQHSKEVGAGKKLGAGGLQQQSEARPGAGLSHSVVPPQLCGTPAVDKSHLYSLKGHKKVLGEEIPGMDGCISASSKGSSLAGCSSGLLSLVIVLRILWYL